MKKKKLTNKQIELVDLIFQYLKNELSFNLDINDDLDIYEKFEVVDKIIYTKNTDNKKIYELNKLLYKIFLYLRNNKNYKFIFPESLYKFIVDSKYFGYYEIELLNIKNCENTKENNIILKNKKFDKNDIVKLKNFYKKYKNFKINK